MRITSSDRPDRRPAAVRLPVVARASSAPPPSAPPPPRPAPSSARQPATARYDAAGYAEHPLVGQFIDTIA